MSKRRALVKNDYTVGWVCALSLEMAAAKGMLDEVHEDLQEQDTSDHNSYILGHIDHHNIVIASLPAGIYGTTTAASVAKDMLRTFPSIRFGLMVGIGGGAPSSTHDIRLGDVVVSEPHGMSGGVIQYDRGKTIQEGKFQRTGSLNSPPMILLTALGRLQAEHEGSESKIPRFLKEMFEKYPKMHKEYAFQGALHDQLYQATYDHPKTNATCERCDLQKQVQRERRDNTDPQIHYGNIASSNQVMKHGVTRDQLCKELDVLCFEMEAAGLMPDFPCLVIRGICDYSDSHKNKNWQRYAAATAAGFAKELLGVISADRVRQEKAIVQVSDPVLQRITSSIDEQVRQHTKRQKTRDENDRHRACHHAFKTSTYEQFKNNNPDRAPKTCRWVLETDKYARWWQAQKDDLLYISADPGCGKSVLARSLIDNELQSTSTHTTCYFFFKDNEEQASLVTALCALLHQLFSAQPQLLRYAMESWDKNSQKLQTEVYELWRILLTATTSKDAYRVTVVMDALDECREKDRQILIELLSRFYIDSSRPVSTSSCLKFLVISRPYNDIEDDFREFGSRLPTIRLRGELENDTIREEIDLVVRQKVANLADKNGLSPGTTEKLQQKLLDMENRTYLWLHLTIQDIDNTFKRSLQPDSESIESLLLPTSVEDAYEKILTRVPETQKQVVTHIFHIIVGARRPLTTSEMAMALGILRRRGSQPFSTFKIAEGRLKGLIRDLCGLFIFINHSKIYLIHQTAKEFLIQRGLEEGTGLWRHSLDPSESETTMARICVEYLSLDELYHIAPPKTSEARHSPTHHTIQGEKYGTKVLLSYSSEYWAAHFRNASFGLRDASVSKARELCRVEGVQFQLWFPLHWQASRQGSVQPDMTDLRLAAFNGHEVILRMILGAKPVDLDAQDQHQRTALIWAAKLGHDRIVQILLDAAVDTDPQDRSYVEAFHAALDRGHEKVVQILLNAGAAVESRDEHMAPLQAASERGHEKVVQILLDAGAKVNARGGFYGNALQAASREGHVKIVQMLLDTGAKVNAQGGVYGNALQAASLIGNEQMIQMFLDKNVKINAQGGLFGNALQAASFGGHEKVVRLFLKKGARVNVQGGRYGNALQAASVRGNKKVVQMLLDKSAEVNAQGGEYGNALQAASDRGHEKVVQMLLDGGAKVNAQGEKYENTLQAASKEGHEKVGQTLFGGRAEVNAQGGFWGNALQAASKEGHEKVK